MFVLKTLQTNVCLDPSMLGQETIDAVESILKKRYSDRVMQQVGLVVHVYDVLHIGEGSVYHSRGNVYHDVEFRAIVFCPFQSELLIGRITQMNESGIHVSLGFFDDVFVPPNCCNSQLCGTVQSRHGVGKWTRTVIRCIMLSGED
eukprot:jgi/Picre1/29075/NNA_004468.t1